MTMQINLMNLVMRDIVKGDFIGAANGLVITNLEQSPFKDIVSNDSSISVSRSSDVMIHAELFVNIIHVPAYKDGLLTV